MILPLGMNDFVIRLLVFLLSGVDYLTPQTRGEYIYYIGFITLSDVAYLYKPAMVLTLPPTQLYLLASHYVDFNILL